MDRVFEQSVETPNFPAQVPSFLRLAMPIGLGKQESLASSLKRATPLRWAAYHRNQIAIIDARLKEVARVLEADQRKLRSRESALGAALEARRRLLELRAEMEQFGNALDARRTSALRPEQSRAEQPHPAGVVVRPEAGRNE